MSNDLTDEELRALLDVAEKARGVPFDEHFDDAWWDYRNALENTDVVTMLCQELLALRAKVERQKQVLEAAPWPVNPQSYEDWYFVQRNAALIGTQ